jgi:hypothetical protein
MTFPSNSMALRQWHEWEWNEDQWETQNMGVGQQLASLLTFQDSINSRCLMTPHDFPVVSVVPGLHVASCRDDGFVHKTGATERVSPYFRVSKGP